LTRKQAKHNSANAYKPFIYSLAFLISPIPPQMMFSIAAIWWFKALSITAPKVIILVRLERKMRTVAARDCDRRPRKKSVKSETNHGVFLL